MTVVDVLLRRLEAEQAEHAKGALTTAQNRDAFEYGRVVGIYAGLEHARKLILDLLEEADRADADL